MQDILKGEISNPRGFGDTPDPQDENVATDQEQQDYDLLTIRARKIIFGDGKEQMLSMLGSSETPAQGMGQAASMIVKSLMSSSKESGREINADSAINAGVDIVTDLNDLAKANNVFKYDDEASEKKEIEEGVLWGVKYYGDGMIQNGEITPEMEKMAKEEIVNGINDEITSEANKKPMAKAVGKAVNKEGILAGAMKPGGM